MGRQRQIVHLLPCLGRGGAGRAALVLARTLHAMRAHEVHRLVSLDLPESTLVAEATAGGQQVVHAPTLAQLWAELEAADVVLVHYWHHPRLAAMLEQPWPATRLVIWCHVAGSYAPQILNAELVALADRFVGSSPVVLEQPAIDALPESARTGLRTIWSTSDFAGLDAVVPVPHQGFHVGYFGNVSPAKLHPDFIALCARIAIPDVRFLVFGQGDPLPLQQQAAAAQIAERMVWGGYVKELGPMLGTFDILGYPLCPETYATAELALQEAMYVGIPPVMLNVDGRQRTIIHGETGLVARTGDEYVAAIEYLYRQPQERARLGSAAATYVREHWGINRTAAQFAELLDDLLGEPKRQRPGLTLPRGESAIRATLRPHAPAAWRFAENVAQACPWFLDNLSTKDAEARLASDAQIASSSPVVMYSDGGIFQYAQMYPADGMLARWAGLVLAAAGRPALAVAQFATAQALTPDDWTLAWHVARTAVRANAYQRARAALAQVLTAAPAFQPALTLRDQIAADAGQKG